MLKEADHLEKVKRLRVSDSDVASLKPAYEVSAHLAFACHCNGVMLIHVLVDRANTAQGSVCSVKLILASDVAVYYNLCDVVLSRLNVLHHSLLPRAYAKTRAYRAKACTKLLA